METNNDSQKKDDNEEQVSGANKDPDVDSDSDTEFGFDFDFGIKAAKLIIGIENKRIQNEEIKEKETNEKEERERKRKMEMEIERETQKQKMREIKAKETQKGGPNQCCPSFNFTTSFDFHSIPFINQFAIFQKFNECLELLFNLTFTVNMSTKQERISCFKQLCDDHKPFIVQKLGEIFMKTTYPLLAALINGDVEIFDQIRRMNVTPLLFKNFKRDSNPLLIFLSLSKRDNLENFKLLMEYFDNLEDGKNPDLRFTKGIYLNAFSGDNQNVLTMAFETNKPRILEYLFKRKEIVCNLRCKGFLFDKIGVMTRLLLNKSDAFLTKVLISNIHRLDTNTMVDG